MEPGWLILNRLDLHSKCAANVQEKEREILHTSWFDYAHGAQVVDTLWCSKKTAFCLSTPSTALKVWSTCKPLFQHVSTSEDATHYPSDFHSTTHFSTQLETWRMGKLVSTSCIQRPVTSTVIFFFSAAPFMTFPVGSRKLFLWYLSHIQMFLNSTYLPWCFHYQTLTHTHQQESGVPKVSCNTQGLQFQEKTKSLNNLLLVSLPLNEEHWKLFRAFCFLNYTSKASNIFERNLTWPENNLQKTYDSSSITWKRIAAYPTHW